ncbi:MAG: hypothetical protein HQK55_12635, partial [Deltaproteobacteria bacterium]|nr:hypothetical protein [Deltaproteobacteria bacterium]
LPAPTPEGVGQGIGEQRFLEAMRQAEDMSVFLDRCRYAGYPPGAPRAFIMAKVLEKTRVIIVGSQTPDLVEELHMLPADDMDQALSMAAGLVSCPRPEVLIVPHALQTLPVLTSK